MPNLHECFWPRFRARLACVMLGVLLCPLTSLLGAGETVEVLFLQTTDIHGYIETSDELDAGGGWLRLATLIGRNRQAAGRDRTLLIDCGDTCQGGVGAAISRGQVGVDLLNALEYDVWVPGNHELDFGVRRCWELCRAAGARTLCGNLELTVDGERCRFPAWRLFERGGARIAVIGAAASYLENWLWGAGMTGYTVEMAIAMLARIMPEVLRAKPDMVVLAAHQGWHESDPRGVNEVAAIVGRHPEIDLILGGHTHRRRTGVRLGKRTWYVQAGQHAGHLAVVRATIDLERHRVTDLTSHLVPAGADVPPDAVKIMKERRGEA